MDINYLVEITVKNRFIEEQTVHYFNNREIAEDFFYTECKKRKLPCHPIPAYDNWSDASTDTVIVEFEKICPLTLSSIFELQ